MKRREQAVPVGISPEPVLLRALSEPLLLWLLSDPLRRNLQLPSDPVLLTTDFAAACRVFCCSDAGASCCLGPLRAGSLCIELLEALLRRLLVSGRDASLPLEPPDSLRLRCILGTVTTNRFLASSLSEVCTESESFLLSSSV